MNVQVTQQELEEIFYLQEDVAPKLKRIEELKSNVKALLIHKMPVELGRFDAILIKRPFRNVPWARAVIENLGQKFADEYKKNFPVFLRTEVKVEEHAVAPLWKDGSGSIEIV